MPHGGEVLNIYNKGEIFTNLQDSVK